ncbi:MAG: hypothetical protein AAGC64_10955 [Bacteroidota bacterium]
MKIKLCHFLIFILFINLGCQNQTVLTEPLDEKETNFKIEIFHPNKISTKEYSENTFSFTYDENSIFVSRTSGWEFQAGFISTRQNKTYSELIPVALLDSIYNGAINPSGNKIIFCSKINGKDEIYLIEKIQNSWSNKVNLSEKSGIYGGYFYWFSDTELYLYVPEQNGNLVKANLLGDDLKVTDRLPQLNTKDATEFSIYIDKKKSFLIFTRYQEKKESEQGFFISFNLSDFESPNWSKPQKIESLPYGWNPYIKEDKDQFLFSDGNDIIYLPMDKIRTEIMKLKNTATNK